MQNMKFLWLSDEWTDKHIYEYKEISAKIDTLYTILKPDRINNMNHMRISGTEPSILNSDP